MGATMSRGSSNTAEEWRSRAERCRKIAEALEEPFGKKVLLELAKSYDEMASTLAKQALARSLSVVAGGKSGH